MPGYAAKPPTAEKEHKTWSVRFPRFNRFDNIPLDVPSGETRLNRLKFGYPTGISRGQIVEGSYFNMIVHDRPSQVIASWEKSHDTSANNQNHLGADICFGN